MLDHGQLHNFRPLCKMKRFRIKNIIDFKGLTFEHYIKPSEPSERGPCAPTLVSWLGAPLYCQEPVLHKLKPGSSLLFSSCLYFQSLFFCMQLLQPELAKKIRVPKKNMAVLGTGLRNFIPFLIIVTLLIL